MNKAKNSALEFDFFKSKNPLIRVVGLLIPTIKGEDNLSQNIEIAKKDLSFQDAALVQALSFGTARFFHRLDFIKNKMLKKPLAKKDADINALLLVGLFQLVDKASPDYAIVNNCVSAIEVLQKDWAKAFVNAILRNFIRKFRDDLVAGNFTKITQNPIDLDILQFSHPFWIIENLRKNYPENYKEILQANNRQAPLVLRTNAKKIQKDEYLKLLESQEISAKSGLLPNSIYLESPIGVEKLPNFAQGFVSLQDESAQLLPFIMQLSDNIKVLDACCAPGGKTCAILEATNSINLLALDKDFTRLKRVKQNLQRLDFADLEELENLAELENLENNSNVNLNENSAQKTNKNSHKIVIKQADFLDLADDISTQKFDRILLDVPCSASGIIRRHPDIKLMRKQADLKKFVAQEMSMLKIAKNLLQKDGLLIYATCSVFKEENANLIENFLKQNLDLKIDLNLIEILKNSMTLRGFLDKAIITDFGIQFLPTTNANDGFFYAPIKFK